MDHQDSLGYWIRRRRKALDLTQHALARQIGCAVSTIRKWEADERLPAPASAERLATTLGLTTPERAAFLLVARQHQEVATLGVPTSPPPSSLPLSWPPLPVPLTPLIGRTREVAEVCRHLARAEVRLLTLTGVGGVGKTRLALATLAELQTAYADGAVFVALGAVRDPDLVLSTIAQTLGLREVPHQPLLVSLQASLQSRHLLLVLDNFEHLLAAAPVLVDLLGATQHLNVLVTSRSTLPVYGGYAYDVPPLALPVTPDLPLDDIQAVAAIRLFVDRAQAVQADFALTPANAAAVVAICARLDGLPLAIELAAARVTLLSPAAILARFDRRLGLLTGSARDRPARQQSLRATLDWSYDLLTPQEQRLFRRLGVFVGRWTLDAAEAVCGTGDLDVLAGVSLLLDQSLVRRVAEPRDTEPYLLLLETIRDYALERLEASDEAVEVRGRHAAYYLELAEVAASELRGPEQHMWLDRLEAEHANLRVVLRWALEWDAAELGLRLCLALVEFWTARGYWSESRRWLDAALARSVAAVPAEFRARALQEAAKLAFDQNDLAQARLLAEEGLALARTLNDPGAAAWALVQLAQMASGQGDLALQQRLLEESLTLFRTVADVAGSSLTLCYLAASAFQRGDPVCGQAYVEERLALVRTIEDKHQIVEMLIDIASHQQLQGAYGHAHVLLGECLALFRDLGDWVGRAETALSLGSLARDQGDYARAEALIAESVALAREAGNKRTLAKALHDLGETALLCEADAQARTLEEECLALGQELGWRFFAAWPLLNLGHIAKHEGEYGQAVAYIAESLTILRERGWTSGIVACVAGLAGVACGQGHLKRATRLFGAVETALEAGHLPPLFQVHRAEQTRDVAATRAQLDEAIFTAVWAAGRAMTLEQAVAYALEEAPDG